MLSSWPLANALLTSTIGTSTGVAPSISAMRTVAWL